MARAAVDLYESTGNPEFLDDTSNLTAQIDAYYIHENGGYFFAANDNPHQERQRQRHSLRKRNINWRFRSNVLSHRRRLPEKSPATYSPF
tara:strand:- start:145 stop:414 length:270 start_codon:yes stop_codon:yes gene_type:complete